MLIKDILSDTSAVCTMETYLSDVAQKMVETKTECLPVVESMSHRNLIGIVSEHDICSRAIANGLNPQRTTAGRVLNDNFETIDEDAAVDECFRKMIVDGVKYLAVVNNRNQCVGLLTRERLADMLPGKFEPDSESLPASSQTEINYTDRIF